MLIFFRFACSVSFETSHVTTSGNLQIEWALLLAFLGLVVVVSSLAGPDRAGGQGHRPFHCRLVLDQLVAPQYLKHLQGGANHDTGPLPAFIAPAPPSLPQKAS